MNKNLYELIKEYDELANKELALSIINGTGEFNEPHHFAEYKKYKKLSEETQRDLMIRAAQAILDIKEEIQCKKGKANESKK